MYDVPRRIATQRVEDALPQLVDLHRATSRGHLCAGSLVTSLMLAACGGGDGGAVSPISTFTHAPSGTTVTVLGTDANGAYRVRVAR